MRNFRNVSSLFVFKTNAVLVECLPEQTTAASVLVQKLIVEADMIVQRRREVCRGRKGGGSFEVIIHVKDVG